MPVPMPWLRKGGDSDSEFRNAGTDISIAFSPSLPRCAQAANNHFRYFTNNTMSPFRQTPLCKGRRAAHNAAAGDSPRGDVACKGSLPKGVLRINEPQAPVHAASFRAYSKAKPPRRVEENIKWRREGFEPSGAHHYTISSRACSARLHISPYLVLE